MIITAISREVWTRMTFHSSSPITSDPTAAPLLDGITMKRTGEFRIDGEKDLPLLTMVELNATHKDAKLSGSVSLFLKTKRKHGWFAEDSDGEPGLYDWAERVMDAIETSPVGTVDKFLYAHNNLGVPINANHGQPAQLLSTELSWSLEMAEITDLSFLLQIEIQFSAVGGKNANRRTSPISPAEYV
jgi:hypothetical protein